MTLYSYIVKYDTGFAPNPFFGYCTLACCKPGIRKHAEKGDWMPRIMSGSRTTISSMRASAFNWLSTLRRAGLISMRSAVPPPEEARDRPPNFQGKKAKAFRFKLKEDELLFGEQPPDRRA